MKMEILPSVINGSVTLPASKSAAHRALIAAFLSGGKTKLNGVFCGGDVKTTIEILRALGAEINVYKNYIEVDGTHATCLNESLSMKTGMLKPDSSGILELNAGESGSTLRFMLPVLCALGIHARITGGGELPNRPIKSLIDTLEENGAVTEGGGLPLTISGKLRSGEFFADGKVSSQFVTGLLLALPLVGGGTVRASGLSSASYVDVTLDVLKAFGVGVKKDGKNFCVGKDEKYTSAGEFDVEGDWSSAGFFAVAGALTGGVTMYGLNKNSRQGDKTVLDILKAAGAEITFEKNGGITVKKPRSGRLKAFCYNAEDCPDTVPAMCAAAAAADGVSIISGVERLRLKESDRLDACLEMLKSFKIAAEYKNSALYITGGKICGGLIRAFNDHRMSMSAAVAALCAAGGSIIEGAECCEKSYPAFFEDLKRAGADVRER